MKNSLTRSHSELTESLIKKAFIQLFTKHGLEKTTVKDICILSGVSRSAFYQHFDDKYAVLESIEDRLLEDVKVLNQNMTYLSFFPRNTSMPNFLETIQYIADQKEYFLPLISSPGDSRFIHRWKSLMQKDFLRRLSTDHVLPKTNADILVYSMASAIIGMYEYWLTKAPHLNAQQLAELGTRLLWSSFYTIGIT